MTVEIAKNGIINTNIRIFNCRKLKKKLKMCSKNIRIAIIELHKKV